MRKTIFLLGCILSIIGCTSDNSATTDNLNKQNDWTPNENVTFRVSAEVAMKQALCCIEQASTRTTRNLDVESVIPWASNRIWKTQQKELNSSNSLILDTALYIVNLKNNDGFVLVSADSRVPGVMAYIDKGGLTPDESITNPGFQLFLNGLKTYISKEIQSWNTKGIRSGSDPFFTYSINVEPLLSTNWGQGYPYNKYCVINSGLAPAGCVAIATAQIAAYYEYPNSYNGHTYDWTHILASDKVTTTDTIACNSVAHLVHDIGLLVNMIYDQNSSSANSANVQYCWNAFGYQYQWNVSPTFNTIESDLEDGMPVYYRGYDLNNSSGHAWVIDGSSLRCGYTRLITGEIVEIQHLSFVHCNWGWNGLYNGFFVYDALETMYDDSTGEFSNLPYQFNDSRMCYTGVAPDLLGL